MAETLPSSQPPGLSEALEFAALSGPFDPAAALDIAKRGSRDGVAETASALAAVCDTNPDRTKNWLLLGPNRQLVLDTLRTSGRLLTAIEERRARGADDTTLDLLDAIAGVGRFTVQQVRQTLGASSTSTRDWLVRIATVLDWAGEIAPASSFLEPFRTAIKRVDRTLRREEVLRLPFVGRDEEIAKLVSMLDKAKRHRRVSGVFMSGPPGIGKSALMEHVIARFVDRRDSVVIRLDFDRAGLDVTDLRMLTMEAARQVADRIGDGAAELLAERLRTAGLREGSDRSLEARRGFPVALALQIAASLDQANRPLLVVIDTLESLQARGATHLDQLFDWLEQLVSAGIEGVTVLAAGRAAPPENFSRRSGEIVLDGLSHPAALEFAARLEVPARYREAVVERTSRVPLTIKLAADIVRTDGIKALPADKLNRDLASAMLYRILLSRIDDDRLRALAHPGLIVRRISAELLRDVIAPEVGLPRLSDAEARDLFDALARQHWLVEIDPDDPTFVRHRRDIRRDLLPLLYEDRPKLCATIDRAAMRWFAARADATSGFDALYHRLQLLRRPGPRPAISEQLARMFDADTLRELPEAARILVRQVAGDFSGVAPSSRDGARSGDESRLTRELINMIAKSDWAEARNLVSHIQQTGGIDPRGALADAVRTLWWRTGQWHDANWLLRERDRLGEDDSDISALEPMLAMTRAEMRGEFGKAAQFLSGLIPAFDAREVWSSATNIGRHGGLAFRLSIENRVPTAFLRSGGEMPDPVTAAVERWSSPDGRWMQRDLDFARRRLASIGVIVADRTPAWVESQAMASLTPYAALATTLAQADRRLTGRAHEAVTSLLGPLSPLLLSDAIALSSSGRTAIEPIATITNSGLFAEWAEALGFVLEDANLRSVGRAADTWRRTMAGDWHYGNRRPRNWTSAGLDEVLRARIERHHRSPDPESLAFQQLGVWVPHLESGKTVWGLIQQRAPGALGAALDARKHGGPEAAAASLRRYRIPTAFVPSIIVLNELRG